MSADQSPPVQFSASADRNKDHILAQLRACLSPSDRVLEIASGTGQHAMHFSTEMDDIIWQASDRDLATFGLSQTLAPPLRDNLLSPIVIDISAWPQLDHAYDAVFSANCLHIIPEQLLPLYVAGAARSLAPGGKMLLYGPFRYNGAFTTPSNAEFNNFLQQTYPGGGIRDFEAVDALASHHGLKLQQDIAMPANNQFLIWEK